MTAALLPGEPWLDDADPVFFRALTPYRAKDCVYLRRARVGLAGGRVSAEGDFGIESSCYIDDTGHFNAAEFIICFNQLMYTALAESVRRGLLPELSGWRLEDFWARQLPDVLIHRLRSTFSRPISAAAFRGSFQIAAAALAGQSRPGGLLALDTEIAFADDAGGRASGEIRLALVNLPEPAEGGAA